MSPRTVAYLTALWIDAGVAPDAGEEARHVLGLARAVVAASKGDWRVEVIAYGPRSCRQEPAAGVSLRVLGTDAPAPNPAELLSWELPEALAGADVIHVHQPFTRTGDLGLLLARQARRPACVTVHGGTTDALGIPLGSLTLADHLFYPHDLARAFLRTQAPPATMMPGEMLKGGVDTDFFTPAAVPQPRDRFLFVGRLIPPQGVERLIKALPPKAHLTICGQPCPCHLDYLARLQALTPGRSVDIIHPRGAEEVRALYLRSWACILAPAHEDCYGTPRLGTEVAPWAALEAMACGTPVVAAQAGCLAEFISHGETGILFDSDRQLTEHLARLTGNLPRVNHLGRHARQAAVDGYGFAVVAPRLAARYEALAAEAPAQELGPDRAVRGAAA